MQEVNHRETPSTERDSFRAVFEKAGFGVAQVSLDGQWLAVNQSLCEILGCSRQTLLGKTIAEITRFDDLQEEVGNCRRMLRGDTQYFSTEKRHLREDGRVVWLKATITLVRAQESGDPDSFLAVVEDLTAYRRELQRVAIDGDQRFRTLTDKISDLFFTLDGDLKYTYWNRAAENLTGLPAREMLGKSVTEVFADGTNAERALDPYRQVLAHRRAVSFTSYYKVGDRRLLLEVTAYPSRDGISVVAKDITERQLSEQVLQRLAAIVQSSDDAIISVTVEGRVTSWNRGAERLYGYTAAEALGQQLGMLIPPHLEAERQRIDEQALAGNGIQGHATQRLRRDGTLVDVSLSISPIRDNSGVIIGLSAIARDISAWKRAEFGLQRQVQFDELMTRILTRFTTCLLREVEKSVICALQQMAEFLGVDHAHVLIFSPDQTTWSATHEWCGPWVGRQAQAFQDVPVGSAPWSEAKILAGEVIRINTLSEYPHEAAVDGNVRDIHEGMQSILLVPIRGAAGVIVGAVGFDCHAHPTKWSDEDVARCRMVGDAIATVMERMRAEEALRRSEEKFSKAFEASPSIMIIVRVKDRCCLEVNGAFEQHTGLRRTDILGRPLPDAVGQCDLRSFNHTFENVMEQGSVRNTEARLRNQGGESLIVLLSAETIEFDGQSCVLMVAEDISERKQAEDALRESEQRFRVMADNAPMMMWMSDTNMNCTDFNRAWCDFRGQTAEEEMGQGWMEGIHLADREKYLQTRGRAFERQRRFTVEYRLRRHDGAYRWVSDTGVPRFLADGSVVGYIGCCIDIDDQKQAEITRTELSRRLMTAQEAERTRIARELHDGIGQSLALLGIQMQRAGQPVSGRPGRTSPGIPELCAKLKEIGNQVSRLSHQLHSSELEFLGPAVAVKGLCREFGEQYRIKVNCVCTGIAEELDDDIALCFLRVVQEALHNVAKHSRAQTVDVSFTGSPEQLILSVADDGVGFDLEKVHGTAGLGMVSMRERMHLVAGDFTITSAPGAGTRIEAKAPLVRGARSSDKRSAVAGK